MTRAMAHCRMSPGRRTARRSTQVADTGGEETDLFWRGLMRASARAARCRPQAARFRAWCHCRPAGSWWRLKTRHWRCWSPMANLAGRAVRPRETFAIKEPDFGCRRTAPLSILASRLGGRSPLRFDLRARKLVGDPPADQQTSPARQTGIAVEAWHNEFSPTVNGNPIKLKPYERSRSLAINPDSSRFVLGSDWYLQAYDAKGQRIW